MEENKHQNARCSNSSPSKCIWCLRHKLSQFSIIRRRCIMNGSITGKTMRCSTCFIAVFLLVSVVTSFQSCNFCTNVNNKDRRQRSTSYYYYPTGNDYLSTNWGPKKTTRVRALAITAIKTPKSNIINNDEDVTTVELKIQSDDDATPLEGKTVKELIHIAKNYPEYSSKIKLKRDLLEFVTVQQQKQQEQQQQQQQQQQQVRQKRVRVMPPYQANYGSEDDTVVEDELSGLLLSSLSLSAKALDSKDVTNDTCSNDTINKKPLSKRELLNEFVLNRYPPLQQMSAAMLIGTGVDMEDIRAQHHPMLTHLNKTSSDLDIVLIGTASCVPSSTRGVSCTALRLNWRRNSGQNRNVISSSSRQRQQQPLSYLNTNNNNEKDSSSFEAGTWLFDCGECTQLQLQRTSYVKAGKITKIFVTHAHGDHTFGLPGLLCLLGKDRPRDAPPLEIYGPEGLRMWLRVAIRYSVSRIVPNYVVHELKDIPMAPEWRHAAGWYKNSNKGKFILSLSKNPQQEVEESHMLWGPRGLAGEDPSAWISQYQTVNLQADQGYGELLGGRDIYPQFDHPDCVFGAPIWEVEDEGDVTVYAAPMSHGIPCVGYVVKEQNRLGRLRPDLIEPIIKRNFHALQESVIKNPMKIMAVIKNLPIGSSFTFPDGTAVKQSDVVQPPIKGRKIVILGDTLDPRAIEGLARDADVLIHEATNTYLSGIDSGTNLEEVTLDCKRHGHSTPYMAGEFAKRIGARRLILNHFSARYKGDQSLDSIAIMTRIERQAIKASGLPETHVATGWDFMILPVVTQEDEKF